MRRCGWNTWARHSTRNPRHGRAGGGAGRAAGHPDLGVCAGARGQLRRRAAAAGAAGNPEAKAPAEALAAEAAPISETIKKRRTKLEDLLSDVVYIKGVSVVISIKDAVCPCNCVCTASAGLSRAMLCTCNLCVNNCCGQRRRARHAQQHADPAVPGVPRAVLRPGPSPRDTGPRQAQHDR